ncbi:MAG: rRNA maturation RNase YbeY [Planctomycetota bacterium]
MVLPAVRHMDDTAQQLAIAADGDEPPSTTLRFDPLDATRSLDAASLRWIRAGVESIGEHLRLTGELRVRFVGDAEMSGAHAHHMNDPSTTDVITFDLAAGASAETHALDLDLLVCVDEARRHAPRETDRELLLYVLHGVLHALGEDDLTDDASRRMHAREDEVLRAIGVGAVFAPASLAPDAEPHDAR